MRHNKKFNHLGRTAGHRKALLANLAASLIKHKQIITTVAKAKALRVYIEPLITKSKAANNATITPVVKTIDVVRKDGSVDKVERVIKVNSSTSARRLVFSYLKNKEAVSELFGIIAPKVANRNGGYTRILKIGFRQGDAAEMAVIELVDFNEAALKATQKKDTKKLPRRRRKSPSNVTPSATQQTKEKVVDTAGKIEETATKPVDEHAVENTVSEDTVSKSTADKKENN
jgi:large subunit ribosomal protein L17